jgi:hypothetical protein
MSGKATNLVTIPDSLPSLRRGLGSSPQAGGCLMQVVNYLAKGVWTDSHARNVAPALAQVAVLVNDSMCDTHRQTLWPFVPRLIKSYDAYTSSPLANGESANMVYAMLKQYATSSCKACVNKPDPPRASINGRCRCCNRCQRMIDLLDKTLRVFDRLACRKVGHVESVDWSRISPEAITRDRRNWVHRTTAHATVPKVDIQRMIDDLAACTAAFRDLNDAIKVQLHTEPCESVVISASPISWKADGTYTIEVVESVYA